jgi:transposase
MDFKLYLIITILIILLNMSKSPRVDPLRETITEEDQRAFIKCHVLLGDSAPDIYNMIQKIARRKALTRSTVFNLVRQFSTGVRTHTGRKPGPGAPRTQSTDDKLEQLKNLLIDQDDWTEDELANEIHVSQATISRMLNEIGARKISARWVPHELNIGNKQTRIDSCQDNLNMYKSSTDMLNRIIAIDESWLRSYDPQDARSAKRWCLPDQEP